jgi:hypothetical protein
MTSPAPAARLEGRSVFVGRAAELRQLTAALDALFSRRGSLALVGGDAGAGKTALVEQVATIAHQRGLEVLWGRCWESGDTPPYWAWVQILRRHLRARSARAWAAPGEPYLRYLPQVLPELGSSGTVAPGNPPQPDQHARLALFDEVTVLLQVAADAQPLLVVLEDLHAADLPTLSLLQFVARLLSGCRLMILGTYRETDAALSPAVSDRLAALSQSGLRIRLRGLSEDDLVDLLARGYGATASPAFISRLQRMTQGNPFFVHATLTEVWGGRETLTALDIGPDRPAMPDDVRDVVCRSVASLSPGEQRILSIAAVVGQEFDLTILGALSDRPDGLADVLGRPSLARFVAPVSMPAQRWRFSHALVREALYERLANEDRVRLHRRIAELLEQARGRDDDAHVADLAYHWHEATQGGAWIDRAVSCAVAAAERAATRLAYEEAAMHYDRALTALARPGDADPLQQCDLLIALGRMWMLGGDTTAARRTFVEAATLARRLGAFDRLGRAALGFGAVAIRVEAGDRDEALVELLEEVLGGLPRDDGPLRALLSARLAYEAQFSWPVAQLRTLAHEAIDMARRIGDPTTLGYALLWASAGLDWRDLDARLTLGGTMVRLAETSGLPDLALMGHLRRARAFLESGDAAAGYGEIHALERLEDRVRRPSYRWWIALWRVMHAGAAGAFEQAQALAHDALIVGTPIVAGAATTIDEAHRVVLDWQMGRLSEAAARIEGLARSNPLNLFRCTAAWIHAECGREPQARAEFEALVADDFAAVREDQFELPALAILAQTCATLGDRPRARRLHARLLPFAERGVYPGVAAIYLGTSSYYLGRLATTLRRWPEAERHFAAARRLDERTGARPWIARTLHAWAGMLIARSAAGDRARANALLREALVVARRLGMRALARRITQLRKQLASEREIDPSALAGSDPARTTSAQSAPARYVFRREGDFWTVGDDAILVRVRHAKGMDDLAYLLANPDRDVHVLDLTLEAPPLPGHRAEDAQVVRSAVGAGPAPWPDAQARAAYRTRRAELRDDLAEAERASDSAGAVRARAELEAIDEELAVAYRAGKRRAPSDPLEKARKAVAWRIRHALNRLDDLQPEVAGHLRASIKTGICCRYAARAGVTWSLRPPSRR